MPLIDPFRVLLFGVVASVACIAFAQSVQIPEEDITPEGEMATFEMDEGFEVNLFADESDGVANPIAIRFGPRGRLWVLCTWAYPQLEPDDVPDDKLLILEDTYCHLHKIRCLQAEKG